MTSEDVLDVLRDLFVIRGLPAHIRSDNGPEFIAEAIRRLLNRSGVETLYIGERLRGALPESLAESRPAGSAR